MKIVFDNIVFSLQRSGGISVVWYEILKRMLDNKKFDLSFLEYNGATENIFRKKLEINSTPIDTFPVSINRYLNPRLSSINEPFIFHSSYYRTSSDPNAINVTTVHDFIYEKFRSGIRKQIHCSQKRRAIEKSDYIICVSENTKNDLLLMYPKINRGRVFVVHNGCSDNYRPESVHSEMYSRFNKDQYLIYVGVRDEYKRFDLALETAKDLNLGLVIVGGGMLTTEEEKMVRSILPENQYQVFQNISDNELNSLYSNALCLIYPSIYEGFGIPIIEAQKAGCPVVAYNGGAMKEIIGDTPLLFDEFNALEISNLIKAHLFDSDNRDYVVKQGLANSSKYTWGQTFEETINIYNLISCSKQDK
jgi:glycosyltransferase involved in cell wall biosynthesis